MNPVFMEVRDIKKYYPDRKRTIFQKRQYIRAVNGVSLDVRQGEIIGLIGESGCGKTTIARILAGLEMPTAGEIYFRGEKVKKLRGRDAKRYKKEVQYVFEDPYASLNPKKNVCGIVGTGIRAFRLLAGKRRIVDEVKTMLSIVGLSPSCLSLYPVDFSVFQALRIAIARSLAVNPRLLVCDEILSRLDIPLRADIVNLIRDIRRQFGLSVLFISKDLAMIRHISERIIVIYKGRIMEAAPAKSLLENTSHPYTRALISAVALPVSGTGSRRVVLKGETAPVTGEIKGCCFSDRCYMAADICFREPPLARRLVPGHTSYCHFAERV
ncbi:MAG: ABC transporter ATP-binding protein [Spirochaetales bacterium]|nr:ABC transporter ATP-binding protein [Spirochaetales bacterium]